MQLVVHFMTIAMPLAILTMQLGIDTNSKVRINQMTIIH